MTQQPHYWGIHTEETISKVKRQPSEWEKIIANEKTDKGLISKLYKQLIQPNPKVGKRPKQTFIQRRHMDGQHMKRCSTQLIIREMQIKLQ